MCEGQADKITDKSSEVFFLEWIQDPFRICQTLCHMRSQKDKFTRNRYFPPKSVNLVGLFGTAEFYLEKPIFDE